MQAVPNSYAVNSSDSNSDSDRDFEPETVLSSGILKSKQ